MDAEGLIESGYFERKQQYDKSLASTITNGNLCNEPSPIKIFFRNLYYGLVSLVPEWKYQLELGPRAEMPMRYTWQNQMPFIPELCGGVSMPQVWCSGADTSFAEDVFLTDDVIFSDSKRRLFQLVILVDTIKEVNQYEQDVQTVDDASGGALSREETTFILQSNTSPETGCGKYNVDGVQLQQVLRVVSAEELRAVGPPTPHHPDPIRYNCMLFQRDFPGAVYLIVRPDRFTYAACKNREELWHALGRLKQFFCP